MLSITRTSVSGFAFTAFTASGVRRPLSQNSVNTPLVGWLSATGVAVVDGERKDEMELHAGVDGNIVEMDPLTLRADVLPEHSLVRHWG